MLCAACSLSARVLTGVLVLVGEDTLAPSTLDGMCERVEAAIAAAEAAGATDEELAMARERVVAMREAHAEQAVVLAQVLLTLLVNGLTLFILTIRSGFLRDESHFHHDMDMYM